MPGGPAIRASQIRRLDSEIGPAVIPSGGEEVRSLYSWKRRLEARVEAIIVFWGVWGFFGREGVVGFLRERGEVCLFVGDV